ncbi:hypothetical protein IAT40_003269 [Kwoniella sp. CBS 6097]
MASKIPLPRKSSLKRTTTLDIGTTFENHALRYLNDGLYMNVRRVGGAGDGGIDLRGWWWLPRPRSTTPITSSSSSSSSSPTSTGMSMSMEDVRRVKVVAQCKAEKKALGPRAIREMEGVMAGLAFRLAQHQNRTQSNDIATASTNDDSSEDDTDINDEEVEPTIAVLISQSGFTKSTMAQATASGTPLMLIHLPGGKFEPANGTETEHEGLDEATNGNGESEYHHPVGNQNKVDKWSFSSRAGISSPLSSTSIQNTRLSLPSARSRESIPNSSIEPNTTSQSDDISDIQVESIWWNRALSHNVLGSTGGGNLELRKTMVQPRAGAGASAAARGSMSVSVGLWMDGKPVGRCGPP